MNIRFVEFQIYRFAHFLLLFWKDVRILGFFLIYFMCAVGIASETDLHTFNQVEIIA